MIYCTISVTEALKLVLAASLNIVETQRLPELSSKLHQHPLLRHVHVAACMPGHATVRSLKGAIRSAVPGFSYVRVSQFLSRVWETCC